MTMYMYVVCTIIGCLDSMLTLISPILVDCCTIGKRLALELQHGANIGPTYVSITSIILKVLLKRNMFPTGPKINFKRHYYY